MKTLFTLAVAIMAFVPTVFAMDKSMHEDKMMDKTAPVKAIVFYSVNCGSCKILEPRMEEAMKAINTDKVEVVNFDFSSKETIAATKTLAAKKGVDAVLQEYGAKTGFVVILDKNGNEVNKLKVDDTSADIAAKVVKAIVEAS
jgi:thiol-disulfide isomerase/thioredoxin